MVDVNVQELLRSLPYEQRRQVKQLVYEDIDELMDKQFSLNFEGFIWRKKDSIQIREQISRENWDKNLSPEL